MGQLGQFIVNHWGLWLALMVVLLLIFIQEFKTQKNRAKQLSPAAAVHKINHENAVVFDIRSQDLYRAGHIVDAICAQADEFSQPRMEKYKNKPLILVCARGIQAGALASKLREQGFSEPMVLAGGYAAWQEAGLPLVKTKKGKDKGNTSN